MEILSFGGGGRMNSCLGYLEKNCPRECEFDRLIVLPIPTTKDKKLITGTDTELSEIPGLVRGRTLVACYGMPDITADEICERGGVLYDGLYDEQLQEANAEMTAVGAITRIISTSERCPSEMGFGIVGFGRIGKRLTRYLLLLGAHVRVYSGSAETLRALHECGIEGAGYGEIGGCGDLDILINTAPARLIRESDVIRSHHLRIIELASGDGLSGIPRVEKMPGIPSVMFPESSGRCYGERILQRLL